MVTTEDLSAGKALPDPIVVKVTSVDWSPGENRRAEVELRDTAQNPLRLIDYRGANISINWKPNHRYRIFRCHVNKGGSKYDVQLEPSKRTIIEPLGTADQSTRILVVGDTHIGRTEHPKTNKEIDPLGAFIAATEYGIDRNVDAVVHVGDIFHNNATQLQATLARRHVFESLNDAGIPFYYVRGNHETKPGNNLLEELEGEAVFNLSTTGTLVGTDVRLFGIDHCPEGNLSWNELTFPKGVDEQVSILVLHQTLQQLSGTGEKSVDLARIQRRFNGEFAFVVSGHHHDATRRSCNGVSVMYAGAVEQMSKNRNPTDRVVWLLTVTNGSITCEKYDIPETEPGAIWG